MVKRVELKKLPPYEFISIEKHLKKIVEANNRIAVFQDKLYSSRVPSSIFLQQLSFQESMMSTKIEGTRTSIEEVLENDLDGNKSSKDVQEVLNYFKSLSLGKDLVDERGLNTGTFRRIHGFLLSGNVRGRNSSPGELRQIDNWIGSKGSTIETASYVPPSHIDVDKLLSELDNYIANDDYMDDLIKIAIIHVQFESIHPFLDGNGRVGRVLIPLYLYYKGVIKEPNIFISTYLEKNKFKYYGYLNEVRFKNDWDTWVDFFLESIISQMGEYISIIERINERYEEAINVLCKKTENNKIIQVVNAIFMNPIANVKKVAEITNLKQPFVRKYLNILVDEKFLFNNDVSRNKKYYNYYILDIIR